MNFVQAFARSPAGVGRTKAWIAPANCIDCPRKLSQIANDRCLEYQEAEGCFCYLAASVSVREAVIAELREVTHAARAARRSRLARARAARRGRVVRERARHARVARAQAARARAVHAGKV